MDIDSIKELVRENNIVWRNHSLIRMRQRNIKVPDVVNCINTGEIIEEYIEDYPFPSLLILGKDCNDRWLHVLCAEGQDQLWIITTYLPEAGEWFDDMKTRRK